MLNGEILELVPCVVSEERRLTKKLNTFFTKPDVSKLLLNGTCEKLIHNRIKELESLFVEWETKYPAMRKRLLTSYGVMCNLYYVQK